MLDVEGHFNAPVLKRRRRWQLLASCDLGAALPTAILIIKEDASLSGLVSVGGRHNPTIFARPQF